MKLSEVKNVLPGLGNVVFRLENGAYVPEHFHVTEVGIIERHFIDCGGTVRKESIVNFQLWNADDHEHRLKPAKLLKIIGLSEKQLGIADAEVEVEYQNETIGRYDLAFEDGEFMLRNKTTACLAKDQCGIPAVKPKISLAESGSAACCSPGSGCC